MGSSSQLASIMRSLFIASLILGVALAAPDMRMTCEECVREMHSLGRLIKDGAPFIVDYLRGNYCPTVNDVEECEQHLVKYYVCQTAGTCGVVKEYTCEECIEGLEWVQAYLLDPVMIAEFTIYLEQNVCIDEWEGCKEEVAKYFKPMHLMAM